MRPPLVGRSKPDKPRGKPPKTVRRYRTFTDGTGLVDMPRAITLTFGTEPVEPPEPPPVDPATPDGAVLWSADYESNNLLSYFDSTSWNNVPMAPAIVTDPVRNGFYAGAYTIPSGGSRCENVPTFQSLTEGDDLFFLLSTYLVNVPLSTSNWQVVGCQWKNDGAGSPPLAMDIDNGVWNIGGGYGWPGTDNPTTPKDTTRTMGTAQNNVWDDWIVRIRFSDDPSVGKVDVWRNGNRVVTDYYPDGGTLYPNLNSYLKVGYYRSTSITQTSTVYLDNLKIIDAGLSPSSTLVPSAVLTPNG